MALRQGGSFENTEFKFLELRKVRVAPNDELLISGIAASDQLMFVVSGNVVKAIPMSSVFDFVYAKNVINQVVELQSYLDIQLPFTPTYISTSLGSQRVLVVGGVQNGSSYIYFYDVRDIATTRANAPFAALPSLPPTASGSKVITSLEWHPEFGDSLFVATISDGSVVSVGVNADGKCAAVLSTFVNKPEATSVSWSPKGKQLVMGKSNGCVTFYKHNNGTGFTEAKNLAPPDALRSFRVSSLRWVLSSMVMVTYYDANNDVDPNTRFVMVSTPPKVAPEYYDFARVCMDVGMFNSNTKYRADFVPMGNVVMCSSTLSSEVQVLGCESGQEANPLAWQLYMLDDNARVELPMSSSGEDAFPRGFAYLKATPQMFTISESEKYGGEGVPCLLILTSTGTVCPYLVINKRCGVTLPPLLNQAQLPFSAPARSVPSLALLPQEPNVNAPSTVSFAPAQPSVLKSSSISSPFQPLAQSTPTVIKPIPVQPNLASVKQQLDFSQDSSLQNQQQAPPAYAPPVYGDNQTNQAKSSHGPSADSGSENESQAKRPSHVDKDTYLVAVCEEINSFDKLLKESFKRSRSVLKDDIGDPKDLNFLQQDTNELQQIVNAAATSVKDLVEDTDILNGYLLETFASAEEARSRLDRDTDPRYKELLRKRALPPGAAEKLKDIRKLKDYVESQLRDCNEILDQEWDDYLEKRKTHKRQDEKFDSPMALVYKTLSNNQKTIAVLRQNIDEIEQALGIDDSHSSFELANLSIRSVKSTTKRDDRSVSHILDRLRTTTLNDSPNVLKESDHNLSSYVRVKTLPLEKRHRIQAFVEQIRTVPVRKAVVPTDVTKSRLISAVTKAKEKMNKNKPPTPATTMVTRQSAVASTLQKSLDKCQVPIQTTTQPGFRQQVHEPIPQHPQATTKQQLTPSPMAKLQSVSTIVQPPQPASQATPRPIAQVSQTQTFPKQPLVAEVKLPSSEAINAANPIMKQLLEQPRHVVTSQQRPQPPSAQFSDQPQNPAVVQPFVSMSSTASTTTVQQPSSQNQPKSSFSFSLNQTLDPMPKPAIVPRNQSLLEKSCPGPAGLAGLLGQTLSFSKSTESAPLSSASPSSLPTSAPPLLTAVRPNVEQPKAVTTVKHTEITKAPPVQTPLTSPPSATTQQNVQSPVFGRISTSAASPAAVSVTAAPAPAFGLPAVIARSSLPTSSVAQPLAQPSTFGSLASQQTIPTFGSLSQQQPSSFSAFSSGQSMFGGSPMFGATPSAAGPSQSIFGTTTATVQAQSVFGGSPVIGSGSVFGGAPTFGSPPAFGQNPTFGGGSSPFSGVSPGQSIFGGSAAAPAFGSASGSPSFGDIGGAPPVPAVAAPPQFNSNSFTQRRM